MPRKQPTTLEECNAELERRCRQDLCAKLFAGSG